jgi:hypothetical protein
MSRTTVGRVVLPLCGVFLLAAVALKVQGISAGGVGQTLTLLSPQVQFVGMEVEALVAIWLVSGYARRGAWLAGVVLFAILATVSAYLAWNGQASCGCFGRVEVSPWVSLVLDAVCVVALVATRPTGQWLSTNTLLPASVAMLVVGGLIAASESDGARRELARFRGEALLLDGGDPDAGTAPKGESRIVPVTVENITDADLRLIGGTASCSCVATYDLPLTVPAGGKATANVKIKFTGESGRFKHTFVWYTDAPSQTQLSGSVTGQVAAE